MMSDFNINESAEVFNEEENKSSNIFVIVLKWIGVLIIVLICALLFYRCVTSIDHPVVKKVLMNEEFLSAYAENPENVRVQQYGMHSAWVTVDEGRLIEFNNLYHIPSVNQLQFSIKYNHDIVKGEFDGIPFKLRLVDENGKVYEDFVYEAASRERFRYIRVSFDNIVLVRDEIDENGNNLRHSYVLEIDCVQPDGSYKELCKYELYDGDSQRSFVFKDVKFDVE